MDTLLEPPPAEQQQAPQSKRPWRRRLSPVLIISIAVHLAFVAGATIWVVSRYTAARKLTFNAGPKSPNPSQRALEHKVQLQKKVESMSAPPAVPKRVLSTGASKVTLPEMPAMPKTPNTMPAMAAGGQGVSFGTQGAPMSGGGAGGGGAPINFFGLKDVSSRIVLMIDVSDSMFTRTGDADGRTLVKHGKEQNFQKVRDAAIELVQNLTPQTQFGIVRWSGGAYSWRPELVPATEENKKAAIDHIQNDIDMKKAPPRDNRPGGTRHDYALEEAFKLKPQTIFMITDGNATAAQAGGGLQPIPEQDIIKVMEEGQKTLTKPAKISVIYYLTGAEKPDEKHMLGRLAYGTGGQFRTVDAPGRRETKKHDDHKKRGR